MVVRSSTFWWQDSSCLTTTAQSKTVAPICQHERIEPATSPTLPPSTTTEICPPGWVEFEAHCYLFNGSKSSWSNAELDCVQRGSHLISIHSQAEHDFFYSISTNYTWVGATDIVSEVWYLSYTTSTQTHQKLSFCLSFSTKNTVNRLCKSSIPLLFFNLLTANNAVGDFDDLNVILKLTSI